MIEARQVRLIGEDGAQLGVLRLEEALALAGEKQLDLVEVAANSEPAVCKLMDYGRHSYKEKKKRTEARSKQRAMMTKMVKFRPNTYKGDYEVKRNRIRRFLSAGDKVKVVMQFRGREIIHAQHGVEMFDNLAGELSDCSTVDAKPSTEGRFLNMVLAPLPTKVREQRAQLNGQADGEGDGKPS